MLEKDIPSVLAKELSVTPKQIEDTVALLDEGNTVPFIARYRKEATGGLDDEQLRVLSERRKIAGAGRPVSPLQAEEAHPGHDGERAGPGASG